MKKIEEEVYAFIDSQNLNLSVKQTIKSHKTGKVIYSGWNLDFKQFYIYLKDKFNVSKAFLFIGRREGFENLYRNLRRYGYILVFKPTMDYVDEKGETKTKGNVDAELVLQSMIEINNYDKAIIVAGDGDYYCLVRYLVEKIKLGKIVIPNRYSFSSLLNEFRSYFVFCSDLRYRLENKKRE